jgi:hypothetical protein
MNKTRGEVILLVVNLDRCSRRHQTEHVLDVTLNKQGCLWPQSGVERSERQALDCFQSLLETWAALGNEPVRCAWDFDAVALAEAGTL